MNFLVPEKLESGRLILRQFKNTDWRDLHEYYSDAEATKFTLGRALTEGETWRTMCTLIGHWQIHGYGPYAVENKASGRIMGTVGFWYPNDWPEPEIKWGLARRYWRQGFGSEAAALVHATGRKFLPDIALISLINQDNEASIALAMSIGARLEKIIEFRGSPHGIYRHRTTG
ncbi:MAG: GNAT family N-acetyltransferase [Lysobacterales bacterium]|jgi:RimJ/RimL family protein N-acetyltransferase